MKKTISLLLLLTVVFTMCITPFTVQADTTLLCNKTTASNMAPPSGVGMSAEDVSDGIFGLASDEASVLLEREEAKVTKAGVALYFDTTLSNVDSAEDIIIETSILPYSNIESVAFRKSKSTTVGIDDIPVSALNSNQWNKIKIIANTDNKTASVYINGKLYNETPYEFTGFDTTLRFSLYSSAAGTMTVYVDYLKIYQNNSDEAGAETMPLTATSGTGWTADYTSDTLTLDKAYTVSELKKSLNIDGTVSMRVYNDNTYGTVVADEALVDDGYIVVLQTADNLFQYLTVNVNDGRTLIYENNGSVTTNAGGSAVSVADGCYGKTAADKVLNYSRTNTTAYFKPETYTWDTSKVLVAEMQFMVNSNVTYFSLRTSSNNAVASNFNSVSSGKFYTGKWNNLKVVIDVNSKKAALYLNNNKIENDGDLNVTSGDLRFVFGASSSSALLVYYDNIKMYAADSYDAVNTGYAYPVSVSCEDYYYSADTIEFGEYKTLDAIKSVLSIGDEYDVRAYDSGYTEITDGSTLSAGSILVMESATGEIQALTILDNSADNIIWLRICDGVREIGGTPCVTEKEVLGRASDDTSYKVTPSATTKSLWAGTLNFSAPFTKGKDLVYEFSFVPSEYMTSISIQNESNKDVGVGSISISEFNMNEWNKVKLVWDLKNSTAELFINGTLYKNNITMINTVPAQFRAFFAYDTAYIDNTYVCIDDMCVFLNNTGNESDSEAYSLPASGEGYMADCAKMLYVNTGDTITLADLRAKFADASNITIRAYTANYASEITDTTATLSNGNLIVIETNDNIFVTYTFENVEINKIYITVADNGSVVSKVKASQNSVLIVCQLDENGRLVENSCKTYTINSGDSLSENTYTPSSGKGTLRVMLLDSLTSATPLGEKAELALPVK